MNDPFAKRVAAASVAGWWTMLIMALLMLVSWGAFLLLTHLRPFWVLWVMGTGPAATWDSLQAFWLGLFGAWKIVALVLLLLVIWLSLWARRLKQTP